MASLAMAYQTLRSTAARSSPLVLLVLRRPGSPFLFPFRLGSTDKPSTASDTLHAWSFGMFPYSDESTPRPPPGAVAWTCLSCFLMNNLDDRGCRPPYKLLR